MSRRDPERGAELAVQVGLSNCGSVLFQAVGRFPGSRYSGHNFHDKSSFPALNRPEWWVRLHARTADMAHIVDMAHMVDMAHIVDMAHMVDTAHVAEFADMGEFADMAESSCALTSYHLGGAAGIKRSCDAVACRRRTLRLQTDYPGMHLSPVSRAVPTERSKQGRRRFPSVRIA